MKWWWLLLALAGCEEGGEKNVFIALDKDFAPFRTWERVYLGEEALDGHPVGASHGYLNHRTKDSAYPTGTMIVKAFEIEPEWELFAMTKRGGNFNARGAVGWEFFRLRIVDDKPFIVSRGIFAWDPDPDAGVGYGSSGVLDSLCNSCHGTPESAATDRVLSPFLWPGH